MTLGFMRGDRFAATESRRHKVHIYILHVPASSREGASVRDYPHRVEHALLLCWH